MWYFFQISLLPLSGTPDQDLTFPNNLHQKKNQGAMKENQKNNKVVFDGGVSDSSPASGEFKMNKQQPGEKKATLAILYLSKLSRDEASIIHREFN